MTYLILFLSVTVSVALAKWLGLDDRKKIRLLTAFGGAYVFTLTILHLFPEVYESHRPHIGWFVLGGFFVQVFLEYFSHGIEHGHAHHNHKHGFIPTGIMIGLCAHAFVEGMPLGGADLGFPAEKAHRMLLAGIVMHNIPVSVVLFTMLLRDDLPRKKVWALVVLFALMSPLGAFTSNFTPTLRAHETELTAIVIGIFLHLSTTILFEASEEHKINQQKMIGILLGAGIAILSTVFY